MDNTETVAVEDRGVTARAEVGEGVSTVDVLANGTPAAEVQAGVDYRLLAAQVEATVEGCGWVAALANTSALVNDALDRVNWVGFYLACGEGETRELELGPFQGKVACVRIPFGAGVCGTAAASDATQLVPNVHEFPGHIACDSASNSEVVVPLHAGGRVVGVLDLDSPDLARFTPADAAGLELVVTALERSGVLDEL